MHRHPCMLGGGGACGVEPRSCRQCRLPDMVAIPSVLFCSAGSRCGTRTLAPPPPGPPSGLRHHPCAFVTTPAARQAPWASSPTSRRGRLWSSWFTPAAWRASATSSSWWGRGVRRPPMRAGAPAPGVRRPPQAACTSGACASGACCPAAVPPAARLRTPRRRDRLRAAPPLPQRSRLCMAAASAAHKRPLFCPAGHGRAAEQLRRRQGGCQHDDRPPGLWAATQEGHRQHRGRGAAPAADGGRHAGRQVGRRSGVAARSAAAAAAQRVWAAAGSCVLCRLFETVCRVQSSPAAEAGPGSRVQVEAGSGWAGKYSPRCLRRCLGLFRPCWVSCGSRPPSCHCAPTAAPCPVCSLALSLHAPTQELRQTIVPSAKAFKLDRCGSGPGSHAWGCRRRRLPRRVLQETARTAAWVPMLSRVQYRQQF